MIVRVAEAQNMAEFVYGNPMEIVYWGTIPVELLWPRIRIPQLVAIKKYVTINDFACRVEQILRNGQRAVAKCLSALRVRPDDGGQSILPTTRVSQPTWRLDMKRKPGPRRVPPPCCIFRGIIPARTPGGKRVVRRAPNTQVKRDLGVRPEKTPPGLGGGLDKGLAVTQTPGQYQQEREGYEQQSTPRAGRAGLTDDCVTPVQSFG